MVVLEGAHSTATSLRRDSMTPKGSKIVQLDVGKAVAMRLHEAEIMTMSLNGESEEMRRATAASRGSKTDRAMPSRGDDATPRSVVSMLTYRNLLTGTNSREPGILMKPQKAVERIDRCGNEECSSQISPPIGEPPAQRPLCAFRLGRFQPVGGRLLVGDAQQPPIHRKHVAKTNSGMGARIPALALCNNAGILALCMFLE